MYFGVFYLQFDTSNTKNKVYFESEERANY